MLPACTTSQKVYSITAWGNTYTNDSPSGLCSYATGSSYRGNTEFSCTTDIYGVFPIIKVCEPPIKHSFAPFDISIEAAGEIAVAIAAVWATAWVFRTLGEFILSGGNSTKDET